MSLPEIVQAEVCGHNVRPIPHEQDGEKGYLVPMHCEFCIIAIAKKPNLTDEGLQKAGFAARRILGFLRRTKKTNT